MEAHEPSQQPNMCDHDVVSAVSEMTRTVADVLTKALTPYIRSSKHNSEQCAAVSRVLRQLPEFQALVERNAALVAENDDLRRVVSDMRDGSRLSTRLTESIAPIRLDVQELAGARERSPSLSPVDSSISSEWDSDSVDGEGSVGAFDPPVASFSLPNCNGHTDQESVEVDLASRLSMCGLVGAATVADPSDSADGRRGDESSKEELPRAEDPQGDEDKEVPAEEEEELVEEELAEEELVEGPTEEELAEEEEELVEGLTEEELAEEEEELVEELSEEELAEEPAEELVEELSEEELAEEPAEELAEEPAEELAEELAEEEDSGVPSFPQAACSATVDDGAELSDDDVEELFEIELPRDGETSVYYTSDLISGLIYSINDDDEPEDVVGEFVDGRPVWSGIPA